TGTTSEFRGLFQINNDDLTSYFIVGDGDVPEAQTITLAELMANGEDYEAELVEIEGLMTDAMGDFESSTNYDVTDASGAGTLRVPNADDSMIDGTAIPSDGFTFTGVVGQFTFSDPATDGYQLLAIAAEDILADFGLGTFPVPARISGDTSDDPTYARVDIFADPCATSSTGNGVKYEVIPFMVDTAGDYTITTNYLVAGFDGFLFLYEGAFNPDDPCANLIAASDDFNDTSDSQIADESLMTETQYFIVVTGFSATSTTPDEGEYDGLVEGPMGASVTFNEGMTGGGETCEDLAMDLFAYDGYAVDSEGGFVRMFMEITNDSDEDCDVQVWGMSMDALLTNGVFIRPRRSITVPANSILRQGYNQRVPGEIADGDYEYTVSMGVYDDDAPMDSDIYASQMRTISKGAPTLGFNELSYEYIKATYGHDEAEFKAAFLAALPHTTVLKPKDWGTVEHGTPQISPIGVISEELPMETFVVTVGTTVGPNPFRDATTFQFDVPEEAAVSLQVFDVLGRLVATPAEGTFPGGRHSAVFSGRDLQAGTYVYRLQIGSTVETGRVTLAR
ncbi:MAG: T9SS type A sorting domain-containing protein, partial [Bacteroidota bacterium]